MKILFFFFILFILGMFVSSAHAYNFTYNGITGRLDAVGIQNISQDMITTGCLDGSIPQYSSSDALWACRGASNDAVLVGNNLGTGYDQPALPNCTDAGGNHLNYTAATGNFTCGSTSSGGAGAITFPRISEDDVALVSGDVINYTTGIRATNPIGTRINVSGDMATTTAPGIASFDTNSFSIGPSNGGVSIRTAGASGDVQFAMGANTFGGTSGVSWDAAAMRFAPGVSLDMSAIPNSATAGVKLPLALGSVASVSADGQAIWRTSDDILFVGTGTSTKPVGGEGFLIGSGNLSNLTATFSCSGAGGGCLAEATAAENLTRTQYTGTWKNFRINVGTAPGALTAWFCTSKIANVAGNQACSIIGTATTCQDFVSTDAVQVNQTIGWTCTAQGVVAGTTGQSITSIFVPTQNAING